MNLTLVIVGLVIVLGGSLVTGLGWNWDKWHKQNNTPKSNSEIGSTGFKISGSKNVLKGNISIGNQVGFNIGGENNLLEDNLSVGIIESKQDISKIEEILDTNLQNLQQSLNNKSNFDKASLYDTAARKYAVYGIWEKSINNAYKALCLYLEVSQDDPSKIYQKVFSVYPGQFKKDCIDGIIMHLNFIANTVRKEKDKDFSYFLKQLLFKAEKDNNTEAENILKQLMRERVK